ncbi:MAG TPA: hypothetical protein VGK64_19345 [Bryobacteraceae bacterium]
MALFLAAFLGLMVYSTMAGPRYRVEVCMAYEGRTACRTVSAKSEAAAIRAGSDNACADIASGVTDTMRCLAAEPKSVRWLHRP